MAQNEENDNFLFNLITLMITMEIWIGTKTEYLTKGDCHTSVKMIYNNLQMLLTRFIKDFIPSTDYIQHNKVYLSFKQIYSVLIYLQLTCVLDFIIHNYCNTDPRFDN